MKKASKGGLGRSKTKKPKSKTSLSKSKSKARSKSSAVVARYTNVANKRRTSRDAKTRRKAEYLATLPKSRLKRIIHRVHPRRLYRYWFSKDGMLMALKITGVSFGLMIVLSLGLFAYFRKDLPNPREINSRILNQSQSTKFYDRTGEHLLYEVYGDENRTIVEFDQISDAAKWATVAVEDKDFYEHQGVSFSGIIRAAWSNLTSADATGQGGSTITQQFIKNSLLTTDQTYTRKVQEIILALELERLYTKDEILSFYLNEIPYGPQEYGIQAAAQSYFDKDASELNVAESAILAALPQAPSYFSPYGENAEELIGRQHIIINLMRDQGYIDSEQAEKAKEIDILATITPIDERSLYTNIFAPHFVLEVQRQLEEDLDFGAAIVRTGGLKIITTLDFDLQKIAEKAVRDADNGGFCDRNGQCGDNAAIVASDVQTGQIISMVGSRKFTYPGYGSFNAALADRQPGSSFKPFDYSQLFYNERWGPDSVIYDTPTTWGSYQPKNFDFGYEGKMLVREAIGESRNIPAVKAIDIARPENVVGLAIAMGNKSLADDATFPTFDLSYGLGAGEVKLAEHTQAYGTFARGGKYVPQAYILSVENADGDKLLEWEQDPGEQVLDEEIAYLMTDILTDDAARSGTFGYGNTNLVVPGLNHAVKTGSTDGSVDGLMMGYTSYMSVGVWVGNHDNAAMDSFTSHQTGPIFTQFMKEAHEKKKYDFNKEILARPSGIQSVKMSIQTGYAATDKTKKVRTGLFPSWYQKETQDSSSKYTIDTISGFLATECTPEGAKEEKTGGGNWPEVLPDDYRFASWSKTAGYGGSSGAPTEEDNVHKCSDSLPNVSIDTTKLADGVYEFEATVSRGTFKLETLNFKVDGQIVFSENIANNGGTYTFVHAFSSDRKYKVSAEAIDEGLYANSNSKTLNVKDSSDTIVITSHVDNELSVDPNALFAWDPFSGTESYNFCYKESSTANYTCLDNALSTNYSPGLMASEQYNVKIQAEIGGSVLKESAILTITTEDP